jgi:hypothetical protein
LHSTLKAERVTRNSKDSVKTVANKGTSRLNVGRRIKMERTRMATKIMGTAAIMVASTITALSVGRRDIARASDCRQKRGGNDDDGDQGHFAGYVGESPITCIECKEEVTGQSNEYDKLDSFFDCFGGEDSDSLDESEGFKVTKEESEDAVPEWADAEFSCEEFLFDNGESKEGFDKENMVEKVDKSQKVNDCTNNTVMVTIDIHQEALLAREEVINNNNDEWTYWLVWIQV